MAIKLKPNGKYLVDVRDVYGRRITRTFQYKSDAKEFENKHTTQKYQSKLIDNKLRVRRYSMEKALNDFEFSKSQLRPKSVQKYKNFIRQLRAFTEHLGISYLDEFLPDHGTLFFQELVKERPDKKNSKMVKPKPKTVNFYLQNLKTFFQQEVLKDHLQKNPVLHLKNLKLEKKPADYYSAEELKKFFDQEMDDAYRIAFKALLFTGMRFGELSSLTWKDVDLSRRLLFVRSTDSFKTKTTNAERAIPLSNVLFSLLQKLKKNEGDSKYVFTSPKGGQLKERHMLTVCKRIAAKAGIKSNAYLHKFRHTYATMLIHRGVAIQNIKELLGHWSVVETEVYAHNSPELLHAEVGKLDNLLQE